RKQYSKVFASRGGRARAAKLSPEVRKEIASKAARARWRPVATHKQASPPSNDPEIIRRLCARRDQDGRALEYTYVKMIIGEAPLNPQVASLVHPAAESNPIGAIFRAKTYERILSRIDAEEERVRSLSLVGEDTKAKGLGMLEYFRQQIYQ